MKRLMAGLLGAALAASIAAPVSYAADKPEVRIGWVYAMANAPAIIAEKKGMYAAAGIDAKVTEFTAGPILFQALAGNQIDVGYVGFAPAANWYTRGLQTVTVAKVNAGQLAVVVRKDSGINTLADLKGKKIASVKKGSGADAFLRGYVLKEAAQLEPDKDVEIIGMPSGNMGAALMTKVVDAAFMWEPFTTQYLLNGETKVLLNVEDNIPGYPWYVVLVKKDFLEKNRDAVVKLLQAHEEAVDFLNSSPTAGNDIIAATFKPRVAEAGKEENPEAEKIDISSAKDASGKTIADTEVVRLARERIKFDYTITDKDIAFFDRQINWSRNLGFLKGELKATDLVDPAPIKQASAARGAAVTKK
jgi:NitT/TauT family transport system substrate-binding protein